MWRVRVGRAGWLFAEGVVPSLSAPGPLSGGDVPAVVPGESEVEEASQVDGGGTHGQAEPVAFDAAVADSAVTVSDEPGEGAFDEWPPLPVVIHAGPGPPLGSGGSEEFVVAADAEHSTVAGGGAAGAQRTGRATGRELGVALVVDVDGDVVGTGDGAGPVVDAEVVAVELVVVQQRVASGRPRLDHRRVTASGEIGTH